MKNLYAIARPLAFVAAAFYASACANGVPTEEHMGGVWTPTTSACRGGELNSDCVAKDLTRCKAIIDFTNPGQDEATYMATLDTIGTVGGSGLGYTLAKVTGSALVKSLEIITGESVGQGVGTIGGYSKLLYRASVEACWQSFGRDPKLAEQYFASVAYTSKVQSYEEIAAKQVASLPKQ